MTAPGRPGRTVLICRAGEHRFGLPVADVVETMRPLPTVPLAGAPPYVAGAAVIRGRSVPVVRAAGLLEPDGDVGEGGPPSDRAARYVTLRVGDRTVALAVDEVAGVADLAATSLGPVPPLLAGARPDLVESVAVLDRDLLLVLQGSGVSAIAGEPTDGRPVP